MGAWNLGVDFRVGNGIWEWISDRLAVEWEGVACLGVGCCLGGPREFGWSGGAWLARGLDGAGWGLAGHMVGQGVGWGLAGQGVG